jgi:hypothetical protein
MIFPKQLFEFNTIIVHLKDVNSEEANTLFFKVVLPFLGSKGKKIYIKYQDKEVNFQNFFGIYTLKHQKSTISIDKDMDLSLFDLAQTLIITDINENQKFHKFENIYSLKTWEKIKVEYKQTLNTQTKSVNKDKNQELKSMNFLFIFPGYIDVDTVKNLRLSIDQSDINKDSSYYYDDNKNEVKNIKNLNYSPSTINKKPIDIISNGLKSLLEFVKLEQEFVEKSLKINLFFIMDSENKEVNNAVNALKPFVQMNKFNVNIITFFNMNSHFDFKVIIKQVKSVSEIVYHLENN